MNKESWIALVIASIITILVATPFYYSSGSKDKISEGSDTKMTEPIKGTEGTTEPTIMVSNPYCITEWGIRGSRGGRLAVSSPFGNL